MQIAFRTDASIEIGTGHVMRCLTLADALRERGAECLFICRLHIGHLMDLIAERGHRTVALPRPPADATLTHGAPPHAYWLGTDWATDAQETHRAVGAVDCLVVDHYGLDRRWEEALRSACQYLMVIDDLADRPHDCDLLLDQSLGRTKEDYDGLLGADAVTLLGPKYALLRPEFAELRAASLARRVQPKLEHLLLTMGGVDKQNVTGLVLDALDEGTLPSTLRITVVMGPQAPWKDAVRIRAEAMRYSTQVLVGVSDMARLMSESDLAVGAAGSTSWERCCVGLPSFVFALADNQHSVASALQVSGAAVAVENPSQLVSVLEERFVSGTIGEFLFGLSKAAAAITDGEGVSRVADRMVEEYV
ncbi:UDP-2,4-diacetamido-2,4,6-trideoxy-beta-L-altropyranose hydrolase [Mesorhizobium sp. M2D.F.Ca.ET.233.01.1.1]|uniref:UDP-2,4-diacetamido-2,4, 6-trideoxy-beta-L-altropyranose hydrolase n=1 Tax=Mesorhizobium sp. M2D.F.Ca.ET.233.01.1.1 TaxID=2563943 RepID=UPI00109378BC|nr:UDP-2,4-diacetamido-2,4,6-trideoxy-beta-L-altropyranose hydrolase [Mesorhizobium sp. M2D.F.Ca.ET.233.01.1.1]TGP14654.1 UDP-2,4-diacetamido-2,4,6-trideoxy-beta-L-altropyranose hydrolase [Mesorhizobium sp. M2D.F.Ca.ET.233.01.1.1]TGV66851.1 UDP-2,4-diacetamido-2,4,6-trideoxy-beta-L-altropyranose hydrolase [Mesorhizobium sp. M2D.F.Ca.ET.160.01.1.1]